MPTLGLPARDHPHPREVRLSVPQPDHYLERAVKGSYADNGKELDAQVDRGRLYAMLYGHA
jgi:hypothetical protein